MSKPRLSRAGSSSVQSKAKPQQNKKEKQEPKNSDFFQDSFLTALTGAADLGVTVLGGGHKRRGLTPGPIPALHCRRNSSWRSRRGRRAPRDVPAGIAQCNDAREATSWGPAGLAASAVKSPVFEKMKSEREERIYHCKETRGHSGDRTHRQGRALAGPAAGTGTAGQTPLRSV